MKPYEIRNFNIPTMAGISDKTTKQHLGLYAGYVNTLNSHYEALSKLKKEDTDNALVISALSRRIGFELAGVKNHEKYFDSIENGAKKYNKKSNLCQQINKQYSSLEKFLEEIKTITAGMRGIGWTLVVYDTSLEMFNIIWVSDHELGNINLPAVLAIDMWEHAYFLDYAPANKMEYVEIYLNAINWENVEKQFDCHFK